MTTPAEDELRQRIEKLARGDQQLRAALFADLADRIDELELGAELADRVVVGVYSVVFSALLLTAQRETSAASAPKYHRARRDVEKMIDALSEHWLIEPFNADLIKIRPIHRASCPLAARRWGRPEHRHSVPSRAKKKPRLPGASFSVRSLFRSRLAAPDRLWSAVEVVTSGFSTSRPLSASWRSNRVVLLGPIPLG